MSILCDILFQAFLSGKDQICFDQKHSEFQTHRNIKHMSVKKAYKVYEAADPSRTGMLRSPGHPGQLSLHTCITEPGLHQTLLSVYLLFTSASCLDYFWQTLTIADPKYPRRTADLKMLCLAIIAHFPLILFIQCLIFPLYHDKEVSHDFNSPVSVLQMMALFENFPLQPIKCSN